MKYKELARYKLKGKWLYPCLIVLMYMFISGIQSAIIENNDLWGFISNIFLILFAVGYSVYFLRLSRQEEDFTDIFIAFRDFNTAIGYILLTFLIGIIVLFGMFLLLIPGIIWSYTYKFAIYVKYDNPELGVGEVLKLSKEITDGHKMDLFLLDLSFIGWYIVGLLCLIVGLIPVTAYYQLTLAEFYEGIRDEYYGKKPTETYLYMDDDVNLETENDEDIEIDGVEFNDTDIVQENDTDSNLY